MRKQQKKIGCLAMAILLMVTTLISAMPTTVNAVTKIEGRLITVGGKTVNSDMKIADVKKLFGKPKLVTASYWDGYAYTFYGDKYSDYLYLETDSDGEIVCYGSVSPGFKTNIYNYGDKVNTYVRLGCEATDDGILYGVIYYTKYHSDAYERFVANLTENNRNLNKHAVEMWNAVSYLYGYNTPTYFDEQLFNMGAQLADNYSTLYDYCNYTGQGNYFQLMDDSAIVFPDYDYPNPLEFAQKAKNYICQNGNAIGFMYRQTGSDNDNDYSYRVLNGFVNKELRADWKPVAYTEYEQQLLENSRKYYKKSVKEFNAEKSYYEIEPSYDSIDTIEGGKLSEGIGKGAVDYLNAIRVGGGLNPLEYSDELSVGAQCKATYTMYLSENNIINPSPHFPPQVEGLSDEYYTKAQSGSGENLFMCGVISTNIIGSISNALDDSYGTGQYYTRGHRYNLLNPSWKYMGVGNTLQQGCHKMSGVQAYDAEIVSWPTKGVTIAESGFSPSGMWTCWFYNGLKPTLGTIVTIKCLNNGTIWKIDPANLLDSQDYQVDDNLIAYADDSIAFKVGGVYEITYEHLRDLDGKDATYTYRTIYEKAYLSSDETGNPQKILLDNDSIKLEIGSTKKLTATIQPKNIQNKKIYFMSTNPTIATVNECGEITAHSIGTTIITATSEMGSIAVYCKVKVLQKQEGTTTGSKDNSNNATDSTTTKTKLTTKNTTIKLSKTSYTYDGKAKKPTVKVLNAKGKVLKSSNYTVKYSNNVKAGKATVTIKFKGKYTGTIKATYTIKPKTTAITGATRNGSKVALIWKKQATQTSGYQIQYATDKKFTKDKQIVTVSGAKKTSKTIKNLSENKNYYFRIRTYKTVSGKKIYSSWSKAKLIK